MIDSVMVLKLQLSVFWASVCGWWMPSGASVLLCTMLIALDAVTAIRLSRRLARAGKAGAEAGKASSKRFGRSVRTLLKVILALTVGAVADEALQGIAGGFSAEKAVAGAVALWQTMSILENESACSDAKWAREARKWLADKTARHLGRD